MIKKIVVMLLVLSISSFTLPVDDLHEISFDDPELTVMLDNQVRSLCYDISNLQKHAGINCSDEHLRALLDQQTIEFDYETVLRGLHCCLNTPWEPQTEDEAALLASLERAYNELFEEYNQLVKQLATRRLRCKCFTKVSTRELAACNATVKNSLTTNNLVVSSCLRVSGLDTNGIVVTDGTGCFSSTTQLTNAFLAPNSVTGGPGGTIVNNTITPSNLAFNTFQAAAAEHNPLTIIRGSVTGATGAIVSGEGFTVTRNGTGSYTIQFLIPYVNATAYQIFVQPTTGYGNLVSQIFINLSNQLANSFNVSTFNNAGAATDENFIFFTVGSLT